MLYLIDGYNLLHALGVITRDTSPAGLKHARLQLFRLLHDFHGVQSPDVTIVFDAQNSPHGARAEMEYRGLAIRFAVDYPEADDLLEQLLEESPDPRNLTVVSDDRRVRRATRRRGGVVLSCGEYMDRLGRLHRERQRTATVSPDKPAAPDEEETAYWRQTFAELDNEPGMRELFEIPWSEGEPRTPASERSSDC